MADDAVARLDELLREYTDEIRALTYEVTATVDARLADATRMVYSNWNATVVGYSPDGQTRLRRHREWDVLSCAVRVTEAVFCEVKSRSLHRKRPSRPTCGLFGDM
jgi:hypothetical protein